MRREVYDYMKNHPDKWFITEDLAKVMDKEKHNISNSLSALWKQGAIKCRRHDRLRKEYCYDEDFAES